MVANAAGSNGDDGGGEWGITLVDCPGSCNQSAYLSGGNSGDAGQKPLVKPCPRPWPFNICLAAVSGRY